MNLLDPTNDDQPQLDESKNYLEELVGDDKKFKTAEDLAKGKYLADSYVTILEKRLDVAREEMKTLRDQNIAGPKLQELIDKYDALQQQLTSRNNTNNSNEDNKASIYDPKQVESLIDSRVTQIENARKEQSNYALVEGKLKERYGKDYPTYLKETSAALGLTDDEVNSMARKNPNLFIKTFDLDAPKTNESFQTPPRSNQRSDNFAPRTPETRKWSYYLKLKEKDPMAWMEKKIAVQMEKDAQALGKSFYDV